MSFQGKKNTFNNKKSHFQNDFSGNESESFPNSNKKSYDDDKYSRSISKNISLKEEDSPSISKIKPPAPWPDGRN